MCIRDRQRYIRLTELIPELLDMVDEKKIALNPAYELSFLKKEEQRALLDAMAVSYTHLKETPLRRMLETKPEEVLTHAVKGMLPKNALGRAMMRKLFVYASAEHPHAAQKPEVLEIKY